MIAIGYARFDERRLRALCERSRRSEEDLRRRLAARLGLPELPDSHRAFSLDPVAKRLGFLLAKVRNDRRAVERELAMRRRYGQPTLRDPDERDVESRCTEAAPVTDDNASADIRRAVPAAVA